MKSTKTNTKNKSKNKTRDTILTLLIATIVFLICWFAFIRPAINGAKNQPPTTTKQAWKRLQTDDEPCDALVCVKVDNTEFNSQYGYGHIYGRAVNYTGKDLSYIAINFGLYDGDVKTGSCIANQNYLTNGTTWSFEAVCSGTSGSSYKVENVTYY